MKMEQASYLLILISSCFLLEPTLSEKEISLLPTNMEMQLSPGLVQVTWDCNITKSMKNYEYQILLQKGVGETLNVSAGIYKYIVPDHMDFTIHSGFHAEISIQNASGTNETKELTAMPEGKENTGAEHFSCEVYNVSIVNCSWTAGKEAPEDTQYSLDFRSYDISIPCEDYRSDSCGRQVGCVVKSPNIEFHAHIYVQLVGSSKEMPIRFYDELLKLDEYVILDPPRNIRLNYSGNNIEITWERPETYKDQHGNCFEYNININGIIEASNKLGQNSYTKSILLDEKLNVSMRAKWRAKSGCSENENWSRWSEPIIYDPRSGSTSLAPLHHLIVLGIVTAAVLFILVFLCHRFRIWKKLFPKVPQPAMKYFDQALQKEYWDHNIIMESPAKKGDDEECICSPITEISKKDQLEIIA